MYKGVYYELSINHNECIIQEVEPCSLELLFFCLFYSIIKMYRNAMTI